MMLSFTQVLQSLNIPHNKYSSFSKMDDVALDCCIPFAQINKKAIRIHLLSWAIMINRTYVIKSVAKKVTGLTSFYRVISSYS